MQDDNTLQANEKKRVRKCVKDYMAANPAKFQILFLGEPDDREITYDISCVTLKSSPATKLLGVFLDKKLNFKSHIQSLCNNASQKLKTLFRIRPYINTKCGKRLCEAYILSTFNSITYFCFSN